jgi:hypothetical protein
MKAELEIGLLRISSQTEDDLELLTKPIDRDTQRISSQSEEDLGLLPMPINRDTQTKKKPPEIILGNLQCFIFNNFGVETAVETSDLGTVCISCLKMFKRMNYRL